MNLFNIEVEIENIPLLDPQFLPIARWNEAYLAEATEPFFIAVTSGENHCKVLRTKIRGTRDSFYADRYYVSQQVKTLLWIYGGYKVSITGSKDLFDYLQDVFSPQGTGAFQVKMMEDTYDKHFSIELLLAPPKESLPSKFLARHLNGNRLGFDAGGSDYKIVAVSGGKVVYTQDALWHPMEQDNYKYFYDHIMNAMLTAAKKLPRIDAIGFSSAGIVRNNQLKITSLFHSVTDAEELELCENLYQNVAHSMGCEQFQVENDGDVTALAGSMNLENNGVLGLAMSTSQASGFIDLKGNLTHWLNELCFVPVDASADAPKDPWSGDTGCGVNYFSQEAVLRLAEKAGFRLNPQDDDNQKLRSIQMRAEQGNSSALNIFKSIGISLGHTLAYYHQLYQFQYVLLLGRVMSGAGGDTIFTSAQKVLAEEYTSIAAEIAISLPNEEERNITQALAAAALPEC